MLFIRSLGVLAGLQLLVWPSNRKSSSSSLAEGSVAALPVDGANDEDPDALDEKKMRIMLDYVKSVFSPVYDKNRSVWSSMYDEIKRNHPYITVFTWRDGASAEEKSQRAVYLITVQTMLMFLMAVFMDLEVGIEPCCFANIIFV